MLFVFVISFSIINWPAISTKLKYWWRVDYHNATYKPTKQSASQTFPNNRIIIQKIGVDAPIIWNIEASKIHSELSNGVVHYKGTAQAGETGNVFFSGHSSDFIWAKGDYKNVFALLDKLVAGDIITITQNNKTYTYKVNNAFIVKPTETKVLEPTPSPI
jgi:sortase A